MINYRLVIVRKRTGPAARRALAARLKHCREMAAITQAQLAEKLGRPQSYISKIEVGERKLEATEFLELIDILRIDISSFLLNVKNEL